MTEIRRTVPLSTAQLLVEEGVLPASMRKSLADLQVLNYAEVDVVIEYGDADDSTPIVGLQQPDGIMVGFFLPSWVGEQIALPGGEPVNSLHITLAYIGELSSIDVNTQRTLIGTVAELARDSRVLSGAIQGLNTFPDAGSLSGEDEGDADEEADHPGEVPLYAAVNVPGLYELRAALVAALDDAGVPYDTTHTNFTPHVTLAYVDPATVTPDLLNGVGMQPVPVTLSTLTVAIGGAHFDSTLFGDVWGDEVGVPYSPPSAYRPTFAKARFEKAVVEAPAEQFTLAPWYVPDFVDAHGDWMDSEDARAGFHEWMAEYAHEGIRLQHEPSIVSGKVVEGYILPEDRTYSVADPDTGELADMVLKAGTPLVGVKWNDWAWDLVEKGKIRGLSIGGSATPVAQQLA